VDTEYKSGTSICFAGSPHRLSVTVKWKVSRLGAKGSTLIERGRRSGEADFTRRRRHTSATHYISRQHITSAVT